MAQIMMVSLMHFVFYLQTFLNKIQDKLKKHKLAAHLLGCTWLFPPVTTLHVSVDAVLS